MVSVKPQVYKPKFEKKRSFTDKKNVDQIQKKEIKPNSAAAAALAIANQSNKNPVPNPSSSNSPAAPPAPVPPPNTNIPPNPIPPQVQANYPAYPSYPDPYAYQMYAQWQAQYYQQWHWAAMNQALNGNKQSESAKPIVQPPPPPPPAL